MKQYIQKIFREDYITLYLSSININETEIKNYLLKWILPFRGSNQNEALTSLIAKEEPDKASSSPGCDGFPNEWRKCPYCPFKSPLN